jgi:hypothetical protein
MINVRAVWWRPTTESLCANERETHTIAADKVRPSEGCSHELFSNVLSQCKTLKMSCQLDRQRRINFEPIAERERERCIDNFFNASTNQRPL